MVLSTLTTRAETQITARMARRSRRCSLRGARTGRVRKSTGHEGYRRESTQELGLASPARYQQPIGSGSARGQRGRTAAPSLDQYDAHASVHLMVVAPRQGG